ncbi:Alkaline phosphatase [Desulfamplus magnetovallimortis]|uniref:Alkaline phosphatase n=1 Tax=Desulfamplus magnetovallimortis TaxID=1246637 RepID=A0A1W1HKF4_9BACT|nr:alkaline phosphatase [Desulfamplus magnetovallimortis]SLM32895.1 Alkaline phosphatase [Desulfamplus magnetovallimortis]
MRLIKKLEAMTMAIVVVTLCITTAIASPPKYVFFFLGDGMSNTQIQATEAYLATKNAVDNGLEIGPNPGELNADYLLNPDNRLKMTQMPVAGMQTTFDAFALMTDSASSATAFASGIKTRSGVIGMDNTKTTGYKSVAELARELGKKVGIISSVPLNHATPAAYYASVSSRNYYNNIAAQLTQTGYEFFGGGGLISPEGPARDGDTSHNIWNMLNDAGYTVLNDRTSILELKTTPKDKVVCINPWLQDGDAMPYAIDRPETNLSLAEMTDVAINVLQGNTGASDNGFFLMVEGGKIDWACHANDAMAVIGDMIDFDNAVGMALEFYKSHPDDTLIVVTGDHETGGMTIGHATTGYKSYYEKLFGQKNSFVYFNENQWTQYKEQYSQAVCENNNTLNAAHSIITLLQNDFGLNWEELSTYQQERMAWAWQCSLCGYDKSDSQNSHLYGSYEPITVTITHVLNEQASIGWTSYSHTGVPVPLFAQGSDAAIFSGFYDNTDIAKKIASIMGITAELPVVK